MTDNHKEKKTLMVIQVDEEGHTYLQGPLKQKKLCIKHLCAAIEVVTAFQPKLIQSPIIKPGFLGGLRRRR